jgi:hypothetical protein
MNLLKEFNSFRNNFLLIFCSFSNQLLTNYIFDLLKKQTIEHPNFNCNVFENEQTQDYCCIIYFSLFIKFCEVTQLIIFFLLNQ